MSSIRLDHNRRTIAMLAVLYVVLQLAIVILL